MEIETLAPPRRDEPYRHPARPAYRDVEIYEPRDLFTAPSLLASGTPSTLTAAAARAIAEFHAQGILGSLQQVDPGLAGPLYAVFAPLHKQNLAGQYIPGAAATFELDARAARSWHGRGHGILLDEDQFQEDVDDAIAAGLPELRAIARARLSLAGKVVHEFAHALSGGFDGSEGPLGNNDFDPLTVRAVTLDASAQKVDAQAEYDRPLPPFHKHDARFLRAAIHLAVRMIPHVPGLKMDYVIHEKYGLSPIAAYRTALAKETTSRAPIRSLIASSAPAAFRGLWKNDVAKWLFSIPSPTAAQEKAAEDALASCPR
jgi:hypothetical protein